MNKLSGKKVVFTKAIACLGAFPSIALISTPCQAHPIVPVALVYSGPGACAEDCVTAAENIALMAGMETKRVKQNALTIFSTKKDVEKLFHDVAVWIQPGGTSVDAMKAMTPRLKSEIQNFVRSGGGYVGFCAGAFASTDIVGDSNTHGLGLIPGMSHLYPIPTTEATIEPVNWQGKTRYLYWEGGPYLDQVANVPGTEIIGTYGNGTVAAVRSQVGKGRAFVSGIHPEAPQWWRTYYDLNDKDGADFDLGVEMVQWASRAQ